MKTSERIKELRKVLANCTINTDGRMVMEKRIIQLESDIVEALQTAKRKGYMEGLHMCNL